MSGQFDCLELEAIPFVMLPSCGRQKDGVHGLGLGWLILFNIWHCACVSSVFMCSLFFFNDEVYFKVVGSRHPGAPRKAQGSLRRQTRRLLRECFVCFCFFCCKVMKAMMQNAGQPLKGTLGGVPLRSIDSCIISSAALEGAFAKFEK